LFIGEAESKESPDLINFTHVDKSSELPATGESVRAICNFQGTTYVATFDRGVERLDGAYRTLIWPTNSTDPRERHVVSMHADGDKSLWIGTAEAGVFVFDGKQVRDEKSLRGIGSIWSIEGTEKDGFWIAATRG